jgi:ribosomal protein S18 acetylase RimI-like enzyme
MISIRRAEENDWPSIWKISEPVFRSGETYAIPTDISEQEAHQVWMEKPLATYVAADSDNTILGTYYLKANQLGPGSHICNCGYIVSEVARGQGIAHKMCEHSQAEAVNRGFLSMQFNLVVSTNEPAIRVWKKMGFVIVGTVPDAFKHPHQGLVDAFIMYKDLG